MSSWHPNDLVTDQDLVDYESDVMKKFGRDSWLDRRTKVLEDWLLPVLRANSLDPQRLRTRFEADKVFSYTAAVYVDLTSTSQDVTEDDLDLAAVWPTPSSDALYIGSQRPFRGLHWRLLDNISGAVATIAVAYWNDAWTPLALIDGTAKTAGKTLSGGGSMTWGMVPDWTIRRLNQSDPLYWVKVTVSAVPTGAKATQIGVIRRSSLCAPAALRTLSLIFREAPTSQDGPWKDKAEHYEEEADLAMQRALQFVGGEFDTGETPETDLISAMEADQTTEEASGGGGFRWERG